MHSSGGRWLNRRLVLNEEYTWTVFAQAEAEDKWERAILPPSYSNSQHLEQGIRRSLHRPQCGFGNAPFGRELLHWLFIFAEIKV
jgi:hypothetical protein